MNPETNKAEIRYIDTRGHDVGGVPFTQAVVNGLAPGGGLYVPATIPRFDLDAILQLAKLPYAQRAAWVFKQLAIDLNDETIDRIMAASYGTNFDDESICPIHSLDDQFHVLELWHGPTCAFKDMALQCMPRFFQASARKLKEQQRASGDYLILVATSGDTGSAALAGFSNLEGIAISVLFPADGVSDIQRLQMTTQTGANVHVWGVRGNFDDCQRSVKTLFADEAVAGRLKERFNIALSSANSINWGRLAPQIVYYLSAYAELAARGVITGGDLVDVCVPTGNFGNILAAYYARDMGAPIGRLFCASNKNSVLCDFIHTGAYDISDRPFYLTPSPSMDILISSNLERQLFELSGRDGAAITRWMKDLAEKQAFRVNDETALAMQKLFAADFVDNESCLATIADVQRAHEYLIDPHTAVACRVAQRLADDRPVLIASTAHWAKFGANVYRALRGLASDEPLDPSAAALDGCELNQKISAETGSPIPAVLAGLDKAPVRFTEVIASDPASVEAACETFLSSWSEGADRG